MTKIRKSQLLYIVLGFFSILASFQEANFDEKISIVYAMVFIITSLYFILKSFIAKFHSYPFAISLGLLLCNSWVYYLLSYASKQQEGITISYFLLSLSFLFILWNCLRESTKVSNRWIGKKISALLSPLLFGLGIFFLWEMMVIGFRVPFVLLPPPSIILQALYYNKSIFFADFIQTFVYSVIPGYCIGCLSGFLVALLCDKFYFLKQGLLPVGNFMSSLPIVGIAPIMIMWFGFDWQSKSAVIVLITFFPMLINCVTGFNNSSKIELELLQTYNPSYLQKLFFVKLKNATPFIFNALKINSTLALIAGIIAEFFGTPIVGMGFRISTEIGRMNLHLVWGTIIVSAIIGSMFYLFLVLLERKITFWHISIRS